ncbi:hypothetical protein AAFP30_22325 [Gordonia sp. CPCC 205515]|uniref:hypothetical protein n=1 Tax=Gordonia sp. CPCC 205515 TaxID=3140791 RepID=UPI003AF40427
MTWETVKVTRRRSDLGPFAITPQRMYDAQVILLQRNEIGETRVVLGFLVGAEYLPAEQIPGWSGEFAEDLLNEGWTIDGKIHFRSVPTRTYRVAM